MQEKILLNKKAYTGETILWIVRLAITLVVVAVLVMLINNHFKKSLDIEDLRYYSVAERALYSKNCFIKVEDGRPYPGIIDKSSFTQEDIDSCMDSPHIRLGASYSLKDGEDITTIYFNKEMYDDISPLAFAKQYHRVKNNYFVIIEDEEGQRPGSLLIDVAWQD